MKSEEIDTPEIAKNFEQPVGTSPEIEESEVKTGRDGNSVGIGGGLYQGSTFSMDIDPVVAEKDFIIYWKIETLLLVLASVVFHILAYGKLTSPISQSQ